MARIHQRARDIESSISAEYLALLESYYDEWMQTFDACPVLTIKTDDLDFVHKKNIWISSLSASMINYLVKTK